MTAQKTWFLSLDTSIPPDKTIQLGQIITDPRDATSRIAPPIPPRSDPFFQQGKGRIIYANKSLNITGKVFAHCLGVFTLGISAVSKSQRLHAFKIDTYTIYQFEPTPEYVIDAMKDPGLKSAIRKRKHMYMIVGLQVADSAFVGHVQQDTKGGGVEASAPIPATGFDIGGHIDSTKKFEESDTLKPLGKFVFAYRIKRCVPENESYALRSGYKVPPSGAPRLYDTDDPISTAVVDEPQFKLSRIDGDEDIIEGKYHVRESEDVRNSTDRMIVLEESERKWLYYTPAIGVLLYAWLAYYLVGKFT